MELTLKHLAILFIAFLLSVNATTALSAKFVQLDEQQLQSAKALIQSGEAPALTQDAYKKLLNDADALLKVKDFTVTDKEILAPTGDAHDYVSISRYWWPDPSKKDGLPWVRHDGETNPDTQTDKVDRKRIGAMTKAVKTLSYAYYFSGNDAYAKKGVSMIKTWFLRPETKMNPHLQFAQSVPGNNKSRRSGILDGRLIPLWVLDSITLFSTSTYWSDVDQQQMNNWFDQYLTWLVESKVGKSGSRQTNNHGSWYRFQVIALAFYLEKDKFLKEELSKAKVAMAKQFNKEGAQEHELKRTKSFFYSTFNLNAITRTAIIADKVGDTLWDYPSKDTSELDLAINYLIPAANGAAWPHPTRGINATDLVASLSRYSKHTGLQEHKSLLKKLLLNAQSKAKGNNREARLVDMFALFNPGAFD